MEFMTENMIKLHNTFDKYIQEARIELNEFVQKRR